MAVVLKLHHPLNESVMPMAEFIYPGKVFVLKEPYFLPAGVKGHCMLRVDHPNDIVWLSEEDDQIPAAWRTKERRAVQESSQALRMRGNAAVQGKEWVKAARL